MQEIDDFVLTDDAAGGLEKLFQAYTRPNSSRSDGEVGVWISGFYGSGKSHLLKMLAILTGTIANKPLDRDSVITSFVAKTRDSKSPNASFLEGYFNNLKAIPAKSVVLNPFNEIQSGAEATKIKDYVYKAWNMSLGYSGEIGVANLEKALDRDGLLEDFKSEFAKLSGSAWEEFNKGLEFVLKKQHILKAISKVTGAPEDPEFIDQMRSSAVPSPAEWAEEVKNWLDQQTPEMRVNFFIDEAGAFVRGSTQGLATLQTLAEALRVACGNRAWIFATSQEELKAEMDLASGVTTQGDDFSKILDRFPHAVILRNTSIQEVIQKRLLRKTDSARATLETFYREHKESFASLFDFEQVRGTIYPSESNFIDIYPLVNYQFSFLIDSMKGIESQKGFIGEFTSIGARSALGVFQGALIGAMNERAGNLVPFDALFEGFSEKLKGTYSDQVRAVDNSALGNLEKRLIRVLLMVKYIHYFKSNPSNLAALLISELGADKHELVEQVKIALQNLEREVFIERNGDLYSFLTDKEKEIENDILATTVELSEVRKQFLQFIQSEFPLTKINFKGESHSKRLGVLLDEQSYSTVQSEVAIHFLSPFYVLDHNLDVIKAQSTGRDELRVVFQDDKRLRDEINLLAKTNKFFQQKSGSNDPLVQRAIQQKQAGVSQRTAEIKQLIVDGLGRSTLVYNATEISISETAVKPRLEGALQTILAQMYFKLALLNSPLPDEAALGSVFDRPSGSQFDSAKQELLGFVTSKITNHQTVTLAQVLDHFTQREYGWPDSGTKYVVGLLIKDNKIRLSIDGNAVPQTAVLAALRGPALKLEQTLLSVPVDVTPAKLHVVRNFAIDFLSIPNPSSDTQSLGQEVSNSVHVLISEVSAMAGQDYPFVKMLEPFSALIATLKGKNPDWYFSDEFEGLTAELKEAKDLHFSPVKSFLSNPNQVQIFRSAREFVQVRQSDLDQVGGEDYRRIKELLTDENLLAVSNAIVDLKNYHSNASKALDAELKSAHNDYLESINSEVANIKLSPQFLSASDETKLAFDEIVERIIAQVSSNKSITQVRLAQGQFHFSGRLDLWNILLTADSPSAPDEIVVSLASIHVEHKSPQLLASEGDVDVYLSDLKTAMLRAITDNKKIAR